MPTMKNLGGKTALITGASSGIGREFAKQFAALGTNLILVGRNEERLKDTAEGITGRVGGSIKIETITSDLSDAGAPGEIFKQTREKNLDVDILINNAGFGKVSHFEEEPFEMTYDMNMVNMVNVASLCHLFIPPMLSKGEGGVINVSSAAAFQPIPYMANYSATKAYILNFSLALYEEYRSRGVIVSAFCPGNVRTDFHEQANTPSRVLMNFPSVEPDIVVNDAIGGFMDGEPLVIPRAHLNFLQFGISRFIPMKLKLRYIASLYR